jgi:hypothetical protein
LKAYFAGYNNSKPVSYSLAKSASAVSLKDSAGGVLKGYQSLHVSTIDDENAGHAGNINKL